MLEQTQRIFFLNYLSYSSLLGAVFSCLLGIFLLSLRNRSRSTVHLGLAMLSFVPFMFSYLLSHAAYAPWTAFHRWFTVGCIFPALIHLTQWVFKFPENTHPRVSRGFMVGQYVFCGVFILEFFRRSLNADITFRFVGHFWDFDLIEYSRFIALLILLNLFCLLAVGIWKAYITDGAERRVILAITATFAVSAIGPAITNIISHQGLIKRDVHQTFFIMMMVGAFFSMIIIYINSTRDRSSFMAKIVGISLVTVLLTLQFVSFATLRGRESDYDTLKLLAARHALAGGEKPGDLEYILETANSNESPRIIYKATGLQMSSAFLKPVTKAGDLKFGLRAYRRLADAKTGTERHFINFTLKQDARIYEVGYNYRAYRAYIHEAAVMHFHVLMGVLFVLLALFPLFFRGALLNPLRSLLAGLENVNKGDLSVQLPVKVQDEIGYVSESFNRMVSTIRDARDNLENKVRDRTQDLAEAHENLQSAFDRLKELDELKTNFFANISHELRTPLTLIMSPLESLIQEEFGKMTSAQAEVTRTMHRNSQRLLKLINNLLDFSKLEAGRMTLSYREGEMVAYVRELTAAFDSAASAVNLELKVTSNRKQIQAFIDPEKMEKVLLNLLSNAFKFTDSGGVYVEVNEIDEDLEIIVRDTGIGIPPDKLETVFERFNQVDGSASREYEGTGIGLALAREITVLHGGTISAQSQPGSGASFTMRIPRVPEGLKSTAPIKSGDTAMSSMHSGILAELSERSAITVADHEQDSYEIIPETEQPVVADETVLLVEDTHDMRKLLYFLLKPHYKLHTARDGKEGLAKARRHSPDLIVSDVMMPHMNGYELLTAIKNDPTLKSIPVLLLTAKADVTMKIRGLDQGADDYIVKPFNSRELLSRVRSQLRMRGMQKEIRIMRDQLLEMNEKLAGQIEAQVSELIASGKFRNYLPPQLVETLTSGDAEARVTSRRKKMTVFFSDIVDFTRITDEMEPEDLAELLNHYLSEMTTIARAHGAVVDKFVGDAVLCHFGDHQSVGEKGDAIRCVQMAVAMQNRMGELSEYWLEKGFAEPLKIRCGINTGYVAVGNFGSEERLDYTIIGSQVNLASRLESQASPGGILISHSTRALVKDEFQLRDIGEIKAKGFQRSFTAYEVVL